MKYIYMNKSRESIFNMLYLVMRSRSRLQRPSAGHGGACLTVIHVGQISERTSCQEDEGQLPGGAPAPGLWATAQGEVSDLPQHRQVNTQKAETVKWVNGQTNSTFTMKGKSKSYMTVW